MLKKLELQVNDITLLPAQLLNFGKLNCLYEKGTLRYISSGDNEVVRMIYTAVRDNQWNTAPYEIENENIEVFEAGFAINYTAYYKLDKIEHKAVVQIEAKDNTLTYAIKGEALSRFETNRVGICVLHPLADCAGKEVTITQPDGSNYESAFPINVSPHQPFKNVQGMKWTDANGIEAHLSFTGDIFETEDQRNWSDGSYKTYSRPLDLPFPYWVDKGETMEQKVILRINAPGAISATSESNPNTFDEVKIPFPLIGYCRSKNRHQFTPTELRLLHTIPFHHYRVSLNLHNAGWQSTLDEALLEVKQLNTRLELIVVFDSSIERELTTLLDILHKEQAFVYSILPLHKKHSVTPNGLLNYVYDVIKGALPNVAVGYGTNSNFADLNRNRPADAHHDFVSFSLNPQVHATDSRSIIDNLDSHSFIIETAKSFTPGKVVHVSPVTLKSTAEDENDSSEGVQDIISECDPRQHTMFTAWWMLQALKNLGRAGCLTFFEAIGPNGIVKREEDCINAGPLTDDELSTPLYKVLQAVKTFEPKWIIENDKDQQGTPKKVILENEAGERLAFIADGIEHTMRPK